MIVDVHTHTPVQHDGGPTDETSPHPAWRPDGPVHTEHGWEAFDAGVEPADVAIVFNIAVDDPVGDTGLRYRPEDTNTATAEYVAARADRRIGFMSVNPTRPGVWDEVERARALGLKGVKLGANYQRFDPLCEQAMDFYRYCEREGLPILFHQGTSPIAQAPLRYAHPLVTDEIAIACPELRIVMAHVGHPWVRETVATVRKHPHVYTDVSGAVLRPWVCYEALLFAVEWGAAHKLLFGSDFPIATVAETIANLRRVNDVVAGTGMPRIPESVVENTIHADALTALGLDDPRPAS